MKLLFVILILLSCAYTVLLNIMRRRSASNPTPDNLSDVYDAETYERWKKYSGEHCTLDLVNTLVSSAITLILILTDAYAAFSSLFADDFYSQIVSVIIVDEGVGAIIGTVFGYIGTMVIEQKYGFNRSTLRTFIFDRLRAFMLGFALSFALVLAISSTYEILGDLMIPVFVGTLFAFLLLFSFLFPFFGRLANKFTPLPDGELRARLSDLLTRHGYTVRRIEIMDASRRTTKLNAYFTGLGRSKRIVLYDNLVNAMTTDEICAVFAHELGHGLHRDVLKSQVLNLLNFTAIAAVACLVVRDPSIYTAFGYQEINYGFAYVLIGIALGVISPLLGMLINARSRAAEYSADKQAVDEGYGPAMITALKRLARENFSNLSPSRLNVVMEYSHPPLAERIAAVEKNME